MVTWNHSFVLHSVWVMVALLLLNIQALGGDAQAAPQDVYDRLRDWMLENEANLEKVSWPVSLMLFSMA